MLTLFIFVYISDLELTVVSMLVLNRCRSLSPIWCMKGFASPTDLKSKKKIYIYLNNQSMISTRVSIWLLIVYCFPNLKTITTTF